MAVGVKEVRNVWVGVRVGGTNARREYPTEGHLKNAVETDDTL